MFHRTCRFLVFRLSLRFLQHLKYIPKSFMLVNKGLRAFTIVVSSGIVTWPTLSSMSITSDITILVTLVCQHTENVSVHSLGLQSSELENVPM